MDFIEKLKPDFLATSITDISFLWLKENQITCICMDVDSTLTDHGNMSVSDCVRQWLEQMKKNGIILYIVSNNNKDRVQPFADALGVRCIFNAGKPGSKKIMGVLKEKTDCTLFVGDQLFTDILCGNRCGMKTVLVQPVGNDTLFQIKVKRQLEKPLLKAFEGTPNILIKRDEHD